MYLMELRRDADTYHVVIAREATAKDTGNQFDFSNTYTAAIVVDEKMKQMTEPTRIKEVLKRAKSNAP